MSITIKEEINLILITGELEEGGASDDGGQIRGRAVNNSPHSQFGVAEGVQHLTGQVPGQANSPKSTLNKSTCRLA